MKRVAWFVLFIIIVNTLATKGGFSFHVRGIYGTMKDWLWNFLIDQNHDIDSSVVRGRSNDNAGRHGGWH